MDTEWLDRVRAAARTFFADAAGSHGWDHTLRVARLCERIGAREGADRDVLQPAALLHDIGRRMEDLSSGRICHAEKGAELAAPLVRSLPVTVPQRENILHCIRSHRFRGGNRPETLEARVLYDADKLDAIGAVGVARAYLFAGEIGARLHVSDAAPEETRAYSADDTGYREYRVKLSTIRDRMATAAGAAMAADRHAFMERFFERFLMEIDGDR